MTTQAELPDSFREEIGSWLDENFPASMCPGEGGARPQNLNHEDQECWRRAMIEKGYTTPTWPSEYGGGGLSKEEAKVLMEEMGRIGAPMPPVSFFGTSMLGPVLLEFGNEDQKKDHLPRITSGEIQWCQGYSEPGAGSDLASLLFSEQRAHNKAAKLIISFKQNLIPYISVR